MTFNLINLPVEIINIIANLCSESSQAALYRTCHSFRNRIDELIFLIRLRSLHLPEPTQESRFNLLMKHYRDLSKFLLTKFKHQKAKNGENLIDLKDDMVYESSDKLTPALQNIILTVSERMVPYLHFCMLGCQPALPEEDKAIQFLLEAGAQPVTVKDTDLLHMGIDHACSPRTIELMMDCKNVKVGWEHVLHALKSKHPAEVIVSMLNKAVDLPKVTCHAENLIPFALEKDYLSDETRLLIIAKTEKIDFDIIRDIIDNLDKLDELDLNKGIKIFTQEFTASTQVFTALMQKVKIDAEPWHAEYLITWFWNKSDQEKYLYEMGSAHIPLGILLDKALQLRLTIGDYLRNPINCLKDPYSIFFGQEEIIYKLVCVTKAPIDCGTFECAMENHSERVLLEMLGKCDPEKIVQHRTLDIALCEQAPTAVIAKLIEMGCKIDHNLLIRALQNNNSDATILKVMDAYSGDLSFDSFYSFVGNALQYNLSDAILNRLVTWAETVLNEVAFQGVIKECLLKAKERNRSQQLLDSVRSKYKGSYS